VRSFYKKIKYRYYRPSSNPFISGDTFRNYADHIHDDLNQVNPSLVKKGDFIFLKSEFIEDFFENFSDKITNEFFIISHNSDMFINSKIQKFDHQNLIKWFAQNIDTQENSKINFIPIGLENKMYRKNGKPERYLNVNLEKRDENIVFSCFREYSNPERVNIKKIISDIGFINNYQDLKNIDYIKKLSSSKFSICPEGNGVDSHRIWESLILRSIPIVKSNQFVEMLLSNNVPLFVVKDYENLKNLNEDKLSKYYENNEPKFDSLNLHQSQFWIKKFDTLRKEVTQSSF
tara:strand:+ start:834 stop:1700 length:867 start_codon:yes stop_codon:yes gene_type:complete